MASVTNISSSARVTSPALNLLKAELINLEKPVSQAQLFSRSIKREIRYGVMTPPPSLFNIRQPFTIFDENEDNPNPPASTLNSSSSADPEVQREFGHDAIVRFDTSGA